MKTEDCKNYQNVANEYDLFCATLLSKSREDVISARNHRTALFQEKIKAAENVIMSVMDEDKPSLQRAGLYELFIELSSGNHPTILFTVVEYICQTTLKR